MNHMNIIQKRKGLTILTPHGGEFSRLTGLTVDDIYADPVSILRKFSVNWKSIIVLKGAHTLIARPDKNVYLNMSGNSGMATAGSGDVLTGTIAAMHGTGFPVDDAVREGVFLHGLAGDLAALKIGEDGITADNILDYLPAAIKYLRNNFKDLKDHSSYYINEI
jgi:NAD(P)H-hydrate epimerase